MMKRLHPSLLLVSLIALPLQAGWFQNQEQEAEADYRQGHYESAAEKFQDPYRRGVAKYRSGDYASAESEFAQVERESVKLDAEYNLGNARLQQGNLEGAIQAYQEVLSQQPDHEDASYNL
ncbi:hypothetical protein QQ73_19325, partial [Candidatus Endoriftia persephone str. Guaymas]|nr:hypothetical protein [Candidatus Endoriftia persephone str. Guaymas]